VVVPRQWQIRESICEAQSELGVQSGLLCTDVRDLDQREVQTKRFQEKWLWDTAWEARLKNDKSGEAAKRSEIANNLRSLKKAKRWLREEKKYINGGETSRATNAPQGSHGRSAPQTCASPPTSTFTPRPTVTATSIRHRAPPSVPQSSYASASQYSQPPTTSRSAQAQTELAKLKAKIDSIFADPGFSAEEKMARIGPEYEYHMETLANESAAASRYQNWRQGVSTLPSVTA
jgi:hypothetical protein